MSFLIFSDNAKQKPFVATSHTSELGFSVLEKLKNWKLMKTISSAEAKVLIVHVSDGGDDGGLAVKIAGLIETQAKESFVVPEYYFKNKAMECLASIINEEKNQKKALRNLLTVPAGKEILAQIILSPHDPVDKREMGVIKKEFDIPPHKLLPYQVHVAFDYIIEENALLQKELEKLRVKLDEDLINSLKVKNKKLELRVDKHKAKKEFFSKSVTQVNEAKYRGFFGKRKLAKLKKEIEASQEFDQGYYQKSYVNVVKLENPIEDFIIYGLPEFRKPNEYFSPDAYIKKYDDVRAAGIFPFLHYIRHGKKEKRAL
ncbi:hypothetical protein P4544_13915 [Halomonas sp. LY9]